MDNEHGTLNIEKWKLDNRQLRMDNKHWTIYNGHKHLTFRVESAHWTIYNEQYMDNRQ